MPLAQIDSTNFQDFLNELLDVNGVNINPQNLNTDQIIPTVDVTQGGFAKTSRDVSSGSAIDISGMSVRTVTGASTSPGAPPNDFRTKRFIGYGLTVQFDAAGAAAFAGKEIQLVLELIDLDSSIATPISRKTIVGGFQVYKVPLVGPDWSGYMPYGCQLQHEIRSMDGTNFPANTLVARLLYSVVKKRGSWLPW